MPPAVQASMPSNFVSQNLLTPSAIAGPRAAGPANASSEPAPSRASSSDASSFRDALGKAGRKQAAKPEGGEKPAAKAAKPARAGKAGRGKKSTPQEGGEGETDEGNDPAQAAEPTTAPSSSDGVALAQDSTDVMASLEQAAKGGTPGTPEKLHEAAPATPPNPAATAAGIPNKSEVTSPRPVTGAQTDRVVAARLAAQEASPAAAGNVAGADDPKSLGSAPESDATASLSEAQAAHAQTAEASASAPGKSGASLGKALFNAALSPPAATRAESAEATDADQGVDPAAPALAAAGLDGQDWQFLQAGGFDAEPDGPPPDKAAAKSATSEDASTSATVEGQPGKAPSHAQAAQVAPAAREAAPAQESRFAEVNHPKVVAGVRGELLPNGGTMHIRLDPPELGDLQVSVHMHDGVMSASFQTSNDDATRLLSHSLGDLKAVLESQGVSVQKLHVQQAPKDSQGGTGDGTHREPTPEERQSARRDQQRREMVQKMWDKLAKGKAPLDLVA